MRGVRPLNLSQAITPALVLDRGRLRENCERLTRRCNELGTHLRPHMKTLKSIDAARFAIDPTHGGIAVATLNEAEYFADRGLLDIQYAVCIAPDKLEQALDIGHKAPLFSFFVDSLHTARCAVELATRRGARPRIWLEIDCGEHRTGLDPDDPVMVDIASLLMHPAITFEGLATHAGHSYNASGPESLRQIADNERVTIDAAARKLRASGITVNGVSIGSTPTATHLSSAEGLTEVRAGVYMAGDLFQVAIGSMHMDQVAVTVLATVISHNPRRNQIVLDAGGLALSKDRSTANGPGPDQGYGLVLDKFGHSLVPNLTVVDVHQEHGEIRSSTPLPFHQFPIGSKVRIVPNHICMTAAMYEHYLVVDGSERVIDIWGRTGGWS
jgi:D-serine deaminase-like pyridoxal phosphate-dependent protein